MRIICISPKTIDVLLLRVAQLLNILNFIILITWVWVPEVFGFSQRMGWGLHEDRLPQNWYQYFSIEQLIIRWQNVSIMQTLHASKNRKLVVKEAFRRRRVLTKSPQTCPQTCPQTWPQTCPSYMPLDRRWRKGLRRRWRDDARVRQAADRQLPEGAPQPWRILFGRLGADRRWSRRRRRWANRHGYRLVAESEVVLRRQLRRRRRQGVCSAVDAWNILTKVDVPIDVHPSSRRISFPPADNPLPTNPPGTARENRSGVDPRKAVATSLQQ